MYQGDHDLRCLHCMRCRTDPQIHVRFVNAQLMKEQIAHGLVVVLTRVNQNWLNARVLLMLLNGSHQQTSRLGCALLAQDHD